MLRARATDIHFTVPECSRGEATSNNLEETRKQGNTRFGKALYENTRFGKALYENTNLETVLYCICNVRCVV